ncbi:MAG: fibronectin type III domain-containing protein, partial [Thermoplasmatota archaeon]
MPERRGHRASTVLLAATLLLSALAFLSPLALAADYWVKVDMGRPYSGQIGSGLWGIDVGDGDRDGGTEVYAACAQNGFVYRYNYTSGNWSYSEVGVIARSNEARAFALVVGDGDDDGKNEIYVSGRYRDYFWQSWVNRMFQFSYNGSAWSRVDMGGAGTGYITGADTGDGNNDSRQEVFCSNTDGHMYMYSRGNDWNLQDMGNATRYYLNSQWNTPVMRGVAVGDGDNDGYKEVYGAASDQQVYQFVYTGSGWTVREMGRGEDDGTDNAWAEGMYAVAVGDADGDGKNEVYSASFINATIYMYRYNSSSSKWSLSKLVALGASINALHLTIGDGNMDGTDELYAACSNKQVYQILYDSSGAKWVSSSVGSGDGAMRSVAIGSATGDAGLREVYAASGDGHAYQFYADKVPPANPTVWSDTHPSPSTWYTSSNVRVLWKDVGKDISGIDGYSYLWDGSPSTVPDDVKDAEESSSSYTTALPDGAWYFHIKARDNALNWNKSATHFGPIWIDTSPPSSVAVVINNGADYTNDRIVTLSLTASDPSPGSGVAWMSLSNDGSSWSGWEAWSSTRQGWDLTSSAYGGSGSDGTKNVYVKVKDAAGLEIAVEKRASDSIFLDRVVPSSLSVLINSGAEFSASADVSLKLAASDPEPASGLWRMSLSNDGVSWSEWSDWKEEASWSLTSGAGGSDADGQRSVVLRVMDRAGNIGGPERDTIFLDRRPPEGLSIVINDGAEYTAAATVSLAIYATDPDPASQLSEMTLANAESSLGSWEDFASSKGGWSLTAGAGGADADGEKAVYLKVRDRAGNVGGPVKDTIFLDRAKPDKLGIAINGAAAYTTSTAVTLSLTADDPEPASGVYAMQFSSDGATWSDWEAFSASKAYTLPIGDGIKTVYFRAMDRAGNVADAVSDTITLDTHSPVISSIAVTGITDSSAVVTWVTDEEADSGVEFGLTTSYGSSASDGSFVLSHSVTLSDLSASTTYHFRVHSTDRAGNPSSYSGDYVFITSSTPDRTPPVITGVAVSGVTDSLAVVSWRTNEPASSTVLYWTEGSPSTNASDPSFVLRHSILLTGLAPSTTYFFKVISWDPSGNGPASSEQLSFTTLAAPDTRPPVISNVRVSGVTDSIAVVSWETDEPADSVVEYGATVSYGQTSRDPALAQLHQIVLRNLLPAMTYHFRVGSTDATGNGPALSEDMSFATLDAPDTTAPVLTNVRVEGLTEASALILWETDEPADSYVEYGPTTDYGLSVASAELTAQHSLLLLKLSPDTTYHFRVRSTDPSGNSRSGADLSFKTKKGSGAQDRIPPLISGLEVSGVTNARAVVIWRTDEPATSEVEYGTTTAYGLRSSDPAFTLLHSIVLEGLAPSTEYHLRVRSVDAFGNGPSISPDVVFTTSSIEDTSPPSISGVQILNITGTGATIIWTTDEPASSTVEYGQSAYYGLNMSSRLMVLEHSIVLTGLLPNTTYHFRILSTDPSGNAALTTADLNFTTLKSSGGPGPGPEPAPATAGSELPWVWVALALVALLVVVLGLSRWRSSRRAPPGAPHEGEELEVLEMELDAGGAGAVAGKGDEAPQPGSPGGPAGAPWA